MPWVAKGRRTRHGLPKLTSRVWKFSTPQVSSGVIWSIYRTRCRQVAGALPFKLYYTGRLTHPRFQSLFFSSWLDLPVSRSLSPTSSHWYRQPYQSMALHSPRLIVGSRGCFCLHENTCSFNIFLVRSLNPPIRPKIVVSIRKDNRHTPPSFYQTSCWYPSHLIRSTAPGCARVRVRRRNALLRARHAPHRYDR